MNFCHQQDIPRHCGDYGDDKHDPRVPIRALGITGKLFQDLMTPPLYNQLVHCASQSIRAALPTNSPIPVVLNQNSISKAAPWLG